jgi:hypothetical protein
MCQKASGGPFMAFVSFPADQLHWSTPPDIFASSNQAERGFCRSCGTPLTYHHLGTPNISVTLNSLDDPESVRPDLRFSADAEVSWCASLSALPRKEMDLTGDPGFVSHQRSSD